MSRKRAPSDYKRKVTTVTVVIDKGMVGKIIAPKGVNVVVHDYDVEGCGFTDSELKVDSSNRPFAQEVWEGENA